MHGQFHSTLIFSCIRLLRSACVTCEPLQEMPQSLRRPCARTFSTTAVISNAFFGRGRIGGLVGASGVLRHRAEGDFGCGPDGLREKQFEVES